MYRKHGNKKNSTKLAKIFRTLLVKLGVPENKINNSDGFFELLLYPYYEGSDYVPKLSKIDLFFYSYPFRLLYSFLVFFYIIFAEQPVYIKMSLGASIFGCILQGLGGACTFAVVAWLSYNLLLALIS